MVTTLLHTLKGRTTQAINEALKTSLGLPGCTSLFSDTPATPQDPSYHTEQGSPVYNSQARQQTRELNELCRKDGEVLSAQTQHHLLSFAMLPPPAQGQSSP